MWWLLSCRAPEAPGTPTETGSETDSGTAPAPAEALSMADFVLGLQNAGGAIPDAPGSARVNEDSTMEYALIGLGAAYQATGDPKYLDGLERGIDWLAARMERDDPEWAGSFWYAYSATEPYDPIPTSPGPGVVDVRGVDATSTLFVYLLWLHQSLTGSSDRADTYEGHARDALEFVIARNFLPSGWSASSWQLSSTGQWRLWTFAYSADQADVYLGLEAGARLYDPDRYGPLAGTYAAEAPSAFFSAADERFGLGLDGASLDTSFEGFNGVFPQGYLPWVFGASPEAEAATNWLTSRVREDGAVVATDSGRPFALSACMLGLADASLERPAPEATFQWLLTVPFDPETGGVRDTDDPGSPEFTNVAAFCAISLFGFVPLW